MAFNDACDVDIEVTLTRGNDFALFFRGEKKSQSCSTHLGALVPMLNFEIARLPNSKLSETKAKYNKWTLSLPDPFDRNLRHNLWENG